MARTVALILAVLVSMGGTTISQENVADDDLSGVYRCEGKNPDGSPYQGIVQIASVGGTYLVRWTLPNVEVMGVGILRRDSLSVSYFGGTPAIVVYNQDGERLVGEWTMGGAEGAVFSETLTRMRSAPAQPDGKPDAKPEPTRPSGIRL